MKELALFLFFLVVALSAVCAVLTLYIWNDKFRAFVKKLANRLPDAVEGKEEKK